MKCRDLHAVVTPLVSALIYVIVVAQRKSVIVVTGIGAVADTAHKVSICGVIFVEISM